jgi:hypothetical protein
MRIKEFLALLLAITGCTKVTVLTGSERLNTPETFKPPVEINIVAKTDSTNLRLAYAADQVIFNWEDNQSELRVDGGPADGHHTPGAGHIPPGQYVKIKWQVTPTHQLIYVDGSLRFAHVGDYSHINRCVTIFTAAGATVTVKSLRVRHLTNAP